MTEVKKRQQKALKLKQFVKDQKKKRRSRTERYEQKEKETKERIQQTLYSLDEFRRRQQQQQKRQPKPQPQQIYQQAKSLSERRIKRKVNFGSPINKKMPIISHPNHSLMNKEDAIYDKNNVTCPSNKVIVNDKFNSIVPIKEGEFYRHYHDSSDDDENDTDKNKVNLLIDNDGNTCLNKTKLQTKRRPFHQQNESLPETRESWEYSPILNFFDERYSSSAFETKGWKEENTRNGIEGDRKENERTYSKNRFETIGLRSRGHNFEMEQLLGDTIRSMIESITLSERVSSKLKDESVDYRFSTPYNAITAVAYCLINRITCQKHGSFHDDDDGCIDTNREGDNDIDIYIENENDSDNGSDINIKHNLNGNIDINSSIKQHLDNESPLTKNNKHTPALRQNIFLAKSCLGLSSTSVQENKESLASDNFVTPNKKKNTRDKPSSYQKTKISRKVADIIRHCSLDLDKDKSLVHYKPPSILSDRYRGRIQDLKCNTQDSTLLESHQSIKKHNVNYCTCTEVITDSQETVKSSNNFGQSERIDVIDFCLDEKNEHLDASSVSTNYDSQSFESEE